jgi:hypothetical protein
MSEREQVVVIAALAASFTIACTRCSTIDAAEGSSGSTFAGRLDLDLHDGTFLCRRGHTVRVERAEPPAEQPGSIAAA